MAGCWGIAVVAEVALELEEWGFVEVEAEESYQDSDREHGGGSADYAKKFRMEVRVDEPTDGCHKHRFDGVMEDVEAVTVFSKEAQGRVFEESLGG